MKIMVLNDGETFTSIQGCQIVEIPDYANVDDTEDYLRKLNIEYKDLCNASILGGFDEDGNYWVGDPRKQGKKKKIKLEQIKK